MNQEEDLRLIKKAVRGNKKAYGELIVKYQVYLYKTAFMYVKNEDDALDAVQECVTRGMLSIGKLREPLFFKSWMTRILINCIYREGKHKKNVVSIETYQEQERYMEEEVSIDEKIDLYDALEMLPATYKSVIILHYFQDMKIKEVAKAMNIPEGSVKAYMSRAKKKLQSLLKEERTYEAR